MLATIVYGAHDPTCTGCPVCSEEAAWWLTASAKDRAARFHEERRRRGRSMRTAQTFRTATFPQEKAAMPCTCPTTRQNTTTDLDGWDPTPPDPYRLAGKESPKAANERQFTAALFAYQAGLVEANEREFRAAGGADDLDGFDPNPPDTWGLRAAGVLP